jgi:predicted permease
MLAERLGAMWRGLRERESFEAGLDEEIRFHIEARAADLESQGLARAEALRRARVEFGGRETVREECRRAFGLRWFDELRQDLAYAFRTVARRPVFALIAIVTLAIGIGGDAVMFSMLDAVILKTLPVRNPDELSVLLFDSRVGSADRYSWSFIQKLGTAIAPHGRAAAMTGVNAMRLGADEGGARAAVQLISGDWFDTLGVRPAAGRFFSPEECRTEGASPVAVVSAAFWRKQFGEARFAAGRAVRINGYPMQIVGIAPAEFRGVMLERPVDVWAPLTMQHGLGYKSNFSASNARLEQPWPSQENIRWLKVAIRSKAPRSVLAAAAASGLQRDVFPGASEETQRSCRFRLESFSRGHSNLRSQFGRPIYALFAAVTLVLLIVCVNIANLMLARASERRREVAVRLSLGAGRTRLMRQMLTESLLLAGCGAAAGLVLAAWGTAALARAASVVGAVGLELGLDWRVLSFTAAVTVFSVVLFGLLPALRATRLDPAPELKSGAREMHGGSRIRIAGALVAAQVTLSVVLVSGAGLFLHSLRNLAGFDPGFRTGDLLLVQLDLDPNLKDGALAAYWSRLVTRVDATPGVRGSAMGVCALVADCTNSSSGFVVPGYTPQSGEQITFQTEAVTPGYFATAGMRLLAGREFTWREGPGAPAAAIVNEALARRYFAGASPIGRVVSYPGQPDTTIVGVVGDARVNGPRTPPAPMMWRPIAQMNFVTGPTLHVRVDGQAPATAEALRRIVADVDGRVRVASVASLPERLGLSLWRDYLLAGMTAVFGSMALFLACFGLYGTMSHSVARRVPEMGVRLALGAPPRRVLWRTLRESLTLVAIGLAAGLPLSLWTERLVHDLLFEVGAGDPLSLASAAALLFASAAVAAYLPARRASRVDPVVALRYE